MAYEVKNILEEFGKWCQREIAREKGQIPVIDGKPVREKQLTPAERQQRRLSFLKTFLGLFYKDEPPEFKEEVKHALLSKSARKGAKTRAKNRARTRQGELPV